MSRPLKLTLIIGGTIAVALIVFIAYLAGRGWDEAVAQEETRTETTQETAPTSQKMNVGGRDPVALSETLESVAGVSLTPMEADRLATSSCTELDDGASNRSVADDFAELGGSRWNDQQGRMMALTMMLEYCPRHAE